MDRQRRLEKENITIGTEKYANINTLYIKNNNNVNGFGTVERWRTYLRSCEINGPGSLDCVRFFAEPGIESGTFWSEDNDVTIEPFPSIINISVCKMQSLDERVHYPKGSVFPDFPRRYDIDRRCKLDLIFCLKHDFVEEKVIVTVEVIWKKV